MASTYSTSLKLELIGTGDQSGSWGNTTNNNLGTLLEQAIVGQYTVVMANADFTLTNVDGTSDQARNAAIIITGNQNASYSVICPAVQKLYMVTNSLNSGATAYFKPFGGTAISIANGNTILVYNTGTTIVPLNYADKANSVANITGGSATRIPYQTATDTTGFIVAPTAGTFLRWNGTAYDWSSSTGSASTITGGAANQLLYQVGAGSTSFVTAPTAANTNLNWNGTAFNWVSNAGGTTAQALTFNNSGTGGGSSQTFNGSTAITISYNTIGASPLAGSAFLTTTGTVTSGTWSGTLGAISGASLTNLTAANLVGSVPSATTATTATTANALNTSNSYTTAGAFTSTAAGGYAALQSNAIGIGTASNTISSTGSGNVFNFNVAGTQAAALSSNQFVPSPDNTLSLGSGGLRWTTVYATTGTINTSDRNDKQQIADLTAAEKAVGQALKGMMNSFKFNDSVQKKGADARVHFGVIAQDVQAAFEAQGLNANNYGVFCSDTLPDGTIRLGVRYEELFSLILGSI